MKNLLGKSAATALHYNAASGEFDTITWLTYRRTDDLINNVAAFLHTALTYADAADGDLAIDADGKLWRVDSQSVDSPAGADTLRTLGIMEVEHDAQVVAADGDTFTIVLVAGIELRADDTVDATPLDAHAQRTESYVITEILHSRRFGGQYVIRLTAEAA